MPKIDANLRGSEELVSGGQVLANRRGWQWDLLEMQVSFFRLMLITDYQTSWTKIYSTFCSKNCWSSAGDSDENVYGNFTMSQEVFDLLLERVDVLLPLKPNVHTVEWVFWWSTYFQCCSVQNPDFTLSLEGRLTWSQVNNCTEGDTVVDQVVDVNLVLVIAYPLKIFNPVSTLRSFNKSLYRK
jgi:hypothetical protein